MARFRYQKGYVFLRGTVWYGKYREDVVGKDGLVRRVQRRTPLGTKVQYPTKRLAERRLEQILSRINDPMYRPARVATVAEFAERWKTEVLSKRKPSTVHAAESHLKIQILPQLGKLRLDQLGTENQQTFIGRIAGSISRKTLLNVLGTLSSMLRTARNWGYTCEAVDMEKLVLPERRVTTPPRTFPPEIAAKIIDMATGQYRVMFAIAAMTGLRAGEILALKVGDFDFESRVMRVSRSVWRGKISTPKTASSQAPVPMPEVLAEIVKEHIQTLKNGQEFLFLNSRGNLFIAENVVRQALTPILDALKVPRCGFHAFRHGHTSLLLAVGASPTVAQAQLRHADPRVTLGVYGHVIGEAQREAVEKAASVLVPSGPKTEAGSQLIQ